MDRRVQRRPGLRAAGVCAALALAAAALLGSPGSRAGTPALADAESWAFAIGDGMLAGDAERVAGRLGDFDLVVIDGELATRAEIAALRARDTIVLGYVSVGTIESYRSWYRPLKPFRLKRWHDWDGEWFADTSKPRYRKLIAKRIAPRILRKGFDGLFLDMVDMIEMRRHRAQRPGMRRLVRRLARLVHGRGKLLFAQNGAWGMRRFGIARYLDGWNREDVTWTYDFDRLRYVRQKPKAIRRAQRELERMAARGIFVTATDYTRRRDAGAAEESVANACAAGALPYVSNIGLTVRRLPKPPLRCD
jgi:uncharacterized protein (TIGR01370 family)